MERMKREDNFIRKSFSSRNAVPDKLLYKFKTRNQFFQRNLPTSFLFFPFLPSPPPSLLFFFNNNTLENGRWSGGRRYSQIRQACYFSAGRETKTSYPTGYTILVQRLVERKPMTVGETQIPGSHNVNLHFTGGRNKRLRRSYSPGK